MFRTAILSFRAIARRSWAGEFSLPVMVLGGGFAFFSFLIATNFILEWIGNALSASSVAIYIWIAHVAIIFSILAVVLVWWCVGVWRAASKREADDLWSTLAKIVVAGISIAFVGIYLIGLPKLMEVGFQQIRDDSDFAASTVRLAQNGTELEIGGTIARPLVPQLANLLAANPRVTLIDFKSNGGRVGSAVAIRDIISRKGLDTVVTEVCESACTVAFLGGKRRYVSESARIGFHAPIFFDDVNDDVSRSLQIEAIKRGVSPEFARKAYPLEVSDLWYPSVDELKAAHFATDIVRR